jgi:hypothetical protein
MAQKILISVQQTFTHKVEVPDDFDFADAQVLSDEYAKLAVGMTDDVTTDAILFLSNDGLDTLGEF